MHLSQQQQQVIDHCMLVGSVTTAQACDFRNAKGEHEGCYRLSERIRELEAKGYVFICIEETNKSYRSPGEPHKHWTRYVLMYEPLKF